MRVLVFGASGQLGRDLCAVFAARGHLVDARARQDADVTDARGVASVVAQSRPEIIVNAAAHTKVDLCEREPEAAFALNATAVRHIALAAHTAGARLVHFSTDYVFGGEGSAPRAEDDPVAPRSVYGQSKLEGERAALELGERTLVVRTQWLYGPGERNFVYTIASRAARGEALTVVADQTGSPTYTRDVAHATLALIERSCAGVYHVTNAGDATWFEFAAAILALGGFRAALSPCATDLAKYPAPRPAYSTLDNTKLFRDTGQRLRPWRDALAEYLAGTSWGREIEPR
jgi:dTDP-4-dehydrorhamnose reductase